jgi:uncharacterized protein
MNTFGLTDAEREMICAVLARHEEIAEAKIFGSRAKGNSEPNSDIDVALWGARSFSGLASISGELDELPLPYTFDVVAYETLKSEPLREHIDRVGKTLYVRDRKVTVNLRD